MKVAIIGAGISGLSCAYTLEKYGITPIIFERNSFIGEQWAHVGLTLKVFHRPINDVVKFFKNQFDIKINPLHSINTIIHHSPNKNIAIKGNFGYSFYRGKEPYSFKKQLHSHLKKTKIVFNTFADYKELCKKYDYVVIANGSNIFTEELGCWQTWLTAEAIGAIVLGDFDPATIEMWINKDYCNSGYAYLAPINEKKAVLILAITNIVKEQAKEYWELFLYTENINYKIVEEFQVSHKKPGFAYPHAINNILFAGNAGGAIDPFLSFGQIDSVIQGCLAAKAIAKGKDYDILLKSVTKNHLRIHEFRKAFNRLENSDYDKLVSLISSPGFKQFFYDTPFNVVKAGGVLLGMMNKTFTDKRIKN